jgi:hypothetical protein
VIFAYNVHYLFFFFFKAIQKALEPFGIYDLSKLSFMCDRGTNLVKALQNYETLFCFAHRINNVLKRGFFQLKSNQKATNSSATTQTTASSTTTSGKIDSDESSSSTEEEEEIIKPTKQIKIKTKKPKKDPKSSTVVNDPMKLKLTDLPTKAQEIIETIKQCKKLVRYIKKVLYFY